MPKPYGEQLALPMLFKQLAGDGARMAEAELALARAEIAAIVRGYLIGIAVGILCMATAITTAIILAQAGVVALTPFVTNPVFAYLGVGVFLAMTTVTLAFVAGSTLSRKHRPIGVILKWLTGEGATK